MIVTRKGATVWVPPNKLPDLSGSPMIALDVETKDAGLQNSRGPGGIFGEGYLLGLSIAVDDWSGYYPIAHPESTNWKLKKIRTWFNNTFNNAKQIKVGANILYDLEWLRAGEMYVSGPCYDVQVAEPLIDENQYSYRLERLAEKYLPEELWKRTAEVEKYAETAAGCKNGKIQQHLWKLPAKFVGAYGEVDSISALEIIKLQLPILEEQDLLRVFDIETRLIPLLLDMRFQGVRIDENKLEQARTQVKGIIAKEQKALNKLAGKPINVNRAMELGPVYEAQGIQVPRTPKTDKPSFRKEWLENEGSDLSKQVLAVRKAEKTLGTFLDGHMGRYPRHGRIHPVFRQLRSDDGGTVSGRFSSADPNLQQIPSRDPVYAPMCRGIFIPEDGCDWYKNDWSQIEYRLIVHYATLEGLPRAHQAAAAYLADPKTDFHQWAADLVGRPRRTAKDINFGLAYNMGRAKLAESLGLELEEADPIFLEYHREVPFMRALGRGVTRAANRRGYIKTLLHRRRRFNLYEPASNYGASRLKALPKAEAVEEYGRHVQRAFTYKSMNSLIQGSAADIMKIAMVKAYESGVFDVLGIPSLTVHDELDGSKPRTKEGTEALLELKHTMEHCVKLEVPILCDVEVGPNWSEVEEWVV